MKANTWTWLGLLALSVLSFLIDGKTATGLILIAAGVKTTLVGWQFMDLRSAHPIWKLGFLALVLGELGLVGVLISLR